MEKIILVTIGHPAQKVPVLPFSLVNTEEGSEVKAAKNLRKVVAEGIQNFGFPEGIKFNPSDFYYAVYEYDAQEKPSFASDNWYCRMYKSTPEPEIDREIPQDVLEVIVSALNEFTQENIQQTEVMTPVG